MDIERWMRVNMLKLNSKKSEVVLFTSKLNAMQMENVTVRVGNTDITSVNSVKTLGVIFDSAMNMEQHLNNFNIGHIRRYLTNDATQSLVNGLVASRLVYCNALLSGLHQTSINKLQRVENTAARIVTRTSRYSHITPVLINLHWFTC